MQLEKVEQELAKTIRQFRLFAYRYKGHRIRLDIWRIFMTEITVGSVLALACIAYLIFWVIEKIRG